MTKQVSFIIRQFKLDDLDGVISINRKCLPENYPDRFFRLTFSEFPSGFHVCEMDGKLVGYTMARIEGGLSLFSVFHRAKKGHTISIAVLPEYRLMGIGSSLLNASVKAMIDKEATELFLEVRVSNIGGVKLYEAIDYEIIKEIHHYYRDSESAYLMAKKLKKPKD